MKLIPCPSRTQSPGSRLELSACKLERAFSCQLISKAASFAAIVRPLTPLHHPFHQSLLPRSPPHLTNNKLVIIINGCERAMSKVQLKRDSPAPPLENTRATHRAASFSAWRTGRAMATWTGPHTKACQFPDRYPESGVVGARKTVPKEASPRFSWLADDWRSKNTLKLLSFWYKLN